MKVITCIPALGAFFLINYLISFNIHPCSQDHHQAPHLPFLGHSVPRNAYQSMYSNFVDIHLLSKHQISCLSKKNLILSLIGTKGFFVFSVPIQQKSLILLGQIRGWNWYSDQSFPSIQDDIMWTESENITRNAKFSKPRKPSKQPFYPDQTKAWFHSTQFFSQFLWSNHFTQWKNQYLDTIVKKNINRFIKNAWKLNI